MLHATFNNKKEKKTRFAIEEEYGHEREREEGGEGGPVDGDVRACRWWCEREGGFKCYLKKNMRVVLEWKVDSCSHFSNTTSLISNLIPPKSITLLILCGVHAVFDS